MQFMMRNWRNMVAAVAVAGLLVMGSAYVVNAQAEDATTPRDAIEMAIADALGITADELEDQLWAGRTLADLAEAAGLDIADLRATVDAAQQVQRTVQIQAAVEAGDITQEQADWMLEGIAQGYLPGGSAWGSNGWGGQRSFGMHGHSSFGGRGGMFGGDCMDEMNFGYGMGMGMGDGMGYGYGLGYGDGYRDGYGGMGMNGERGMMGRPFAAPDSDTDSD